MGDWESVVAAIRDFAQCVSTAGPAPEAVLATVLFTDLVGSTAMAAELGDRRWRELLEQHHARIRGELGRFRGSSSTPPATGSSRVSTARRAPSAARARSGTSLAEIDLDVRAGVHTGECEVLDGKVAGLAVAIGARVAARAGPGEVLVSSTVRDLVAGSGIAFDDRGVAELKGVPGEWRLFAVASAD